MEEQEVLGDGIGEGVEEHKPCADEERRAQQASHTLADPEIVPD